MKQLNKLNLENVKEKHYEYCVNLIKKEENRDISNKEKETIRKLCCENPFEYTDTAISLKSDFEEFKNSNIDYSEYYQKFRSNNGTWNGVKLFEALDINVCPYCGINYLTTVEKDNSGNVVITATFDHYFPKKAEAQNVKYGFLALNLYNLIPCCRNCNSTFKLGKQEPVLNPYFHNVEQMFEFKLTTGNIINELIGVSDELEIITVFPDTTLCKNHNKIIAINERYKSFKNIAKSLIYKRQKYSKDYLESLESMNLGISASNIEDMLVKQDIFSNDEPLSKFKADIWKQISN